MKRIADFDRAYANRAAKDMGGQETLGGYLGGTPLADFSISTKAAKEEFAGKPISNMDNLLSNIGEAALIVGPAMATNVGYRYGLPAAGVTLAGKALYDLTQNYQTSGTVMPSSSQHVEALDAILASGAINQAQYQAML